MDQTLDPVNNNAAAAAGQGSSVTEPEETMGRLGIHDKDSNDDNDDRPPLRRTDSIISVQDLRKKFDRTIVTIGSPSRSPRSIPLRRSAPDLATTDDAASHHRHRHRGSIDNYRHLSSRTQRSNKESGSTSVEVISLLEMSILERRQSRTSKSNPMRTVMGERTIPAAVGYMSNATFGNLHQSSSHSLDHDNNKNKNSKQRGTFKDVVPNPAQGNDTYLLVPNTVTSSSDGPTCDPMTVTVVDTTTTDRGSSGKTATRSAYASQLENKLRAQELRHIQEKLAWKTLEVEIRVLRKENARFLEERMRLQKQAEEYRNIAVSVIKENMMLRREQEEREMAAVSTTPTDWQEKLEAWEREDTTTMNDSFDDVSIELDTGVMRSSVPASTSPYSSFASSTGTYHDSSTSLSEGSLYSETSDFAQPSPRPSLRNYVPVATVQKHLAVATIQTAVANRVKAVENVPAKEMHRRLLLELNKDNRRKDWESMRTQFGEPVTYHGAAEVKLNNSVKTKTADFSTFTPPMYSNKTESQRALILGVVERNFVFSEFWVAGNARTRDSMAALIDAFEVVAAPQSHVLWPAGDQGEKQAFYIVESGSVEFQSESGAKSVGPCSSFGEQSLLHAELSLFTVATSSESSTTQLLKLDPMTYRGLLHMFSRRSEAEKQEVLKTVNFFETLDEELQKKLISTVVRVEFSEGDAFDTSEDEPFFVIKSGTLRAEDSETSLGAGSYICNPSLLGTWSIDAPAGQFRAVSDGMGFKLDARNFQDHFVQRSRPRRSTHLRQDEPVVSKEMIEVKLDGSKHELRVDVDNPGAVYLMQDGVISIDYDDGRDSEIMMPGDIFGHDQFHGKMTDTGEPSLHRTRGFVASVVSDEATIGVLSVKSQEDLGRTIQHILNDKHSKARQLYETTLSLEGLKRIKLLGEGIFGKVWLVEADKAKIDEEDNWFALKSQSKADDTRGRDALDAIRKEIQVMNDLDHPNIATLIQTFEDDTSLYMLMGFLPGGELLGRIYQETPTGDLTSGMCEDHARFYSYVIADTLAFIHSRDYVFRDLKPENIMIDADGYPVIVDFGFAKHIPEGKTYTFCGTPNYVAPEVILSSGHNRSVDHWALGITLYEMVVGENPFFFEGMDHMTLYETICRDDPYPLKAEDGRSMELIDLVGRLLEKDPTKRLGMLAGGMDDVLSHPWFDTMDTLKLCAKTLSAPWRPPPTAPRGGFIEEPDVTCSTMDSGPLQIPYDNSRAPDDEKAGLVTEKKRRKKKVGDTEKRMKKTRTKDENRAKRRTSKKENLNALGTSSPELLCPNDLESNLLKALSKSVSLPNLERRRSQPRASRSRERSSKDAALSRDRKLAISKALDALGM